MPGPSGYLTDPIKDEEAYKRALQIHEMTNKIPGHAIQDRFMDPFSFNMSRPLSGAMSALKGEGYNFGTATDRYLDDLKSQQAGVPGTIAGLAGTVTSPGPAKLGKAGQVAWGGASSLAESQAQATENTDRGREGLISTLLGSGGAAVAGKVGEYFRPKTTKMTDPMVENADAIRGEAARALGQTKFPEYAGVKLDGDVEDLFHDYAYNTAADDFGVDPDDIETDMEDLYKMMDDDPEFGAAIEEMMNKINTNGISPNLVAEFSMKLGDRKAGAFMTRLFSNMLDDVSKPVGHAQSVGNVTDITSKSPLAANPTDQMSQAIVREGLSQTDPKALTEFASMLPGTMARGGIPDEEPLRDFMWKMRELSQPKPQTVIGENPLSPYAANIGRAGANPDLRQYMTQQLLGG